MIPYNWTSQETQLLKDNYEFLGIDECLKLIPNRTRKSLIHHAKKLGLRIRPLAWSEEETTIIKTLYEQEDISMLDIQKALPNRTLSAIKVRACELRLKKACVWSKKSEELLSSLYGRATNKELKTALPQFTRCAIIRRADKLKLVKIKYDRNRLSDLSILLSESLVSYYWIGFMLADGHFNSSGRFQVNICDEQHIKTFANYIKHTGKIHVKTFPDPSDKHKTLYSLTCYDKEIVTAIRLKFDIQNTKTYNPPKNYANFTEEQSMAILLGFIDGDGCIKFGGSMTICCHSSWKDIITYWYKIAYNYFDIERTTQEPKIGNTGYLIGSLSVSVIKEFKKFAIKNKLPLLTRKWINSN